MIKDVNLSSVLYFSLMNGRGTCIFICPEHLHLVLKSPVLQYLKRRLIFLTIPIFSSTYIMSAGKTFATRVFVSVHVLNLIVSY